MKKSKGSKFYAKALFQALSGVKTHEAKEIIKNFVLLLVKKHQLKKSQEIIKEFIKLNNFKEGIKEVEVTVSRKTDEKNIDKITEVVGKKVQKTVLIDKDILGGFIIKTEDKIIDASLKTQLQKLKQTFN